MAESVGPVTVTGPVDGLEFRSMVGIEQLSQPFKYDVELLSDSTTLAATDFLGKLLTVTLDVRDGAKRQFNGVVTDFSLRASVGQKTLYTVVLRPWLWLLTQRVNSKIHSGTVAQIVKAVCVDYMYAVVDEGLLDDLQINRSFVVQYEETDFNFVMRLLEQDGIYFYFTHTADKHSLVLTSADAYQAPSYESIEFFPPDVHRQSVKDHVDSLVRHESIAPGAFVSKDFDFTAPRAPLLVDVPIARPHSLGDFEVFHYPGGYVDLDTGRALARRRLEALQVAGERHEGQGNVRGIGAGQSFVLTGHPLAALNQEYIVYSAGFHIRTHDHQSGASLAGEDVMRTNFVALARSKPFRPARRTPKPRIVGVQSAVVVGPEKHEIDTDPDGFGMVRVKFHWDRSDVTDGSNCCWIRVSQAWAGTNFGVLFTPRIGQEVLVEFLEGDPDQPIITGRVYNNDNMPPYTLPDNNSQSGIKTLSTLDGAISNFNEIRFEDKKGSEQLFVQAEKTHTVNVKGDRSVTVGGTQTTTVTKKETRTYKLGRKTDVIGPDELHVTGLRTDNYDAGRTQTVTGGDDDLTVKAANKHLKVDLLYEVKTGQGHKLADNTTTKLELAGGTVLIDAPTGITIQCGGSKIELTQTAITITSASVTVTGTPNKLELNPSGATLSSVSEVTIVGPLGIKMNA